MQSTILSPLCTADFTHTMAAGQLSDLAKALMVLDRRFCWVSIAASKLRDLPQGAMPVPLDACSVPCREVSQCMPWSVHQVQAGWSMEACTSWPLRHIRLQRWARTHKGLVYILALPSSISHVQLVVDLRCVCLQAGMSFTKASISAGSLAVTICSLRVLMTSTPGACGLPQPATPGLLPSSTSVCCWTGTAQRHVSRGSLWSPFFINSRPSRWTMADCR